MRRQAVASPATPTQGQELRTDTFSQSLTFVRNLVRLGVSSICYLRNIFPDDCFEDKEFFGLNIKGLRKADADTTDLCNWIEEGAFDALNKKYLHSLEFGIYSNATEEPVETYTFTVAFLNGEARMNFEHNGKQFFAKTPRSKSEVKASSIRLLRKLFMITMNLENLPESHLGFVIKYNDNTPENYEPKYFRAVAKEDKLEFTRKPHRIDIGTTDDGNIRLNLVLQTLLDLPEDTFDDGLEDLNDIDSVSSQNSSHHSPSPLKERSKKGEESESGSQNLSPLLGASPVEKGNKTKNNTSKQNIKGKGKNDEIYEKVKEAAVNGIPSKTFVSRMFPDLQEDQISSFFDRMALTDKVLKVVDGQYKLNDEDPKFMKAIAFVLERDTVSQTAIRQHLSIDGATANEILQKMEERKIVQKQINKNRARVVIKDDRNKLLLAAVKEVLDKEIVSDSESSASQNVEKPDTEMYGSQASSQNSSGSQLDDGPTNFDFSILNTNKKVRNEEARESPTEKMRNLWGQKFNFLNSQDSDSNSNNNNNDKKNTNKNKFNYHNSVLGDGRKSSLVKKRKWEQ